MQTAVSDLKLRILIFYHRGALGVNFQLHSITSFYFGTLVWRRQQSRKTVSILSRVYSCILAKKVRSFPQTNKSFELYFKDFLINKRENS